MTGTVEIMARFKDPDFAERQTANAKAKKTALEKFRAGIGRDDPAFLKRQAERAAIEAARVVRAAAREEARQARERELAAQKARDAEIAAEAARQAEREAAEQAARDLALEAQRKAARDARYAARKARK